MGGEFLSNSFTVLLQEAAIKRELTAPYSSQQNVVVERRNRIVIKMERSLLTTKHLLKDYWVEPTNTTVYLLNRVPTIPRC